MSMAQVTMDPEAVKKLRNALLTARIIWGALLFGMLAFTVVVIIQIFTQQAPAKRLPSFFFYAAIGACLILPVLGFALRHIALAWARKSGPVGAQAWTRANLLCWILIDGAVFFGVLVAMINGSIIPGLLPAAFALLMFILAYPRRHTLIPPSQTFNID